MDGSLTGRGRARAIIAIVALYGLLLQGFLTGLAPPVPAGGDHAICAPNAGPADPDGGTPAHHGDRCCTLACASAVPAPPVLASSAAPAWPPREAASVVWAAAGPLGSSGPPVHSASARGPPVS